MSAALTRPNVIARVVTVAAVAAAIVLIVLLAGGGSSYVINLTMADANGLQPGSQVLLGGVQVGSVGSLRVDRHNQVIAPLDLNRSDVHVGKGISASIIAANLLGEEYVALSPGNRNQPLRSGTTLPESRTVVPTDLDQIFDVLNGSTRASLAALLNEAGTAVAGQKSNVSAILRQLPLSLSAATSLLDTVVQGNHTLSSVVSNSDEFVSQLNGQRAGLERLIDQANGAAGTLGARAGSLATTVRGGPHLLISVDRAFSTLNVALRALHPELPVIAAAAPRLDALLHAVKPFTKAAVPTLNRAASVAPTLTELADRATPTVREAVPTLASLDNIATLASPLSAWLGLSAQKLINAVGSWPQALEYRDGISHIFNGDLYLDPNIVLDAADTGVGAAQKRQNLLDILNPTLVKVMGLVGAVAKARAAVPPQPSQASPTPHSSTPTPTRSPASTRTPAAGSSAGSSGGSSGSSGGIGGLLGGLGKTLGGATHTGSAGGASSSGGTTTGPPTSPAPASGLSGLLGFLVGK
jgi:ABC-type transporter Mla subunit MlaD